MSGPLPAPEFDAQNYARPNQNWTCGHAGEGKACRLGPDAKGRCRATAECKPALETKPGETKGRWRCTRPGEACESGPLPDGSCGRPIARCSPEPTLRVWRGRATLAVIAVSFGLLLVTLGNPPWRNRFISPGELSKVHSGDAFAMLATTNHLSQGCGACHVAGNSGPNGMATAALRAEPGMLELVKLATARPAEPTVIDESCLKCHPTRNFHQPNAPAMSCAFCHAEHQGAGLAATTDANCNFCHGSAGKLAAAGGFQGSAAAVIHHFADDHPQFRFITEPWPDRDTLKFNHELHLTRATIPKLPGGTRLDCTFCHQPDAAGAFMKPVVFVKNCRVCHAFQFDPETPLLTLPHGSADFVSAFLRSLPKQYLNLATNPAAADAFVSQKLAALRTQFGSGEDLERRIFFSSATLGPETQMGTLKGATRAIFPGCAYCHEVKPTAAGAPQIFRPVLPERWLTRAKFNHAKHAGMACTQCHDAVHSQSTADVLLPGREVCTVCHSPHGGVADACAECHTYHRPK